VLLQHDPVLACLNRYAPDLRGCPCIAARLSAEAKSIAENLPQTTIPFMDIVAFIDFASRYAPEQVLNLRENIFVPLDRLCAYLTPAERRNVFR